MNTLRTNKTLDKKPELSPQQIIDFQKELDALRHTIESKMGKEDIDHIQNIIEIQRYLEISGRLLIHFSLEPVSWALGVASLSAAHILENMEIGHNLIHGQYDFMKDDKYNSDYEWSIAGTAKNWKRAHNHHHHAYTNVIGKDVDFGFGAFRISDDIKWKPIHLFQSVISPATAVVFEHAIALYDLQLTQYVLPKWLRQEEHAELLSKTELLQELKEYTVKSSKKSLKEYVFYPLLAGPLAPKVLAGNISAQIIRNLWSFAVIYCGHLPEGNYSFTEQEMEAETKGQWYFRQILGSSNFESNLIVHIMSGHLSHQIEHHLYPDLPAWRYRELGPKVEEICGRYGIPYQKGKMVPMLKTVATNLVKYSVPDTLGQKVGRFFSKKQAEGSVQIHNVKKIISKKTSKVIKVSKQDTQKNTVKSAKAA